VDVLPDMRKSLMAMCKHFHTSVDMLSRKYHTQVCVSNHNQPFAIFTFCFSVCRYKASQTEGTSISADKDQQHE
jgi:hypothetical protein